MTKLLDQAVKAVRTLSTKSQDEIARAMLYLAKDEPENVDPEHLSAVLEGLRQARRGEYASASDVEIAFHRFEK